MPLQTLASANDDGVRGTRSSAANRPSADKAKRVPVLVVDDRAENRLAVESVLRSPDYELVMASSGTEALKFLLRGDCAVILLDVQMPEMDGFETARLIRGKERTRAIPIVFMTGFGRDERFQAQGYAAGAIDYIVKPVDPEVLRSKVWAFAELYRARQEILRQATLLHEGERLERQRALEQLELRSLRRQQVAADRYRRLMDGITHAIVWTLEPVSMACTFVSPSTQILLGVAPDAWTRSPDAWRDRLPPGDRERLLTTLSTMERGASATLDHGLLRADGQVGLFRTNLQFCPAEEEGRLEIRGFSVDVTEERHAEETLAFLAGAAAELAVSLEVEAIVERAARAAVPFLADACAVTADLGDGREARGAAHVEAARLEEARALPEHPRAPRPRPVPHAQLVAVPAGDADPARTDAALLVLPLRARDRDVGSLHLLRGAGRGFSEGEVHVAEDFAFRAAQAIDHAALYREARDAVRARDEFISVASHELRTPLTPLSLQASALSRMVKAELPDGRVRERLLDRLGRCSQQVERITRLVGNLLDVSRMRAKRLQLELESFDLCELVREAASRCQEELAASGRRIEVAAGEPALQGRWDRTRIEQVVANLLGNAIRYGGTGPIEVAVRRGGLGAVIAVSDHGPGIAPQDQARIFDRFERGTTVCANQGLGLGLYIVRHIVAAHGGSIAVESQLGAGSTFKVELPLEASARSGEDVAAGRGQAAPEADAPATGSPSPGPPPAPAHAQRGE